MARYGTGGKSENLGVGNTGFGNVAGFIIDWGNPDYGHRKNIFDTSATHLGVGCHFHAPADPKKYVGFIRCVMNFGSDYKEIAN